MLQPSGTKAPAVLDGNSQFSVTSWTLVGLAGVDDPEARHAALTRLLLRYLPPLRSHLLNRKRIDPHRADDLLQDFVADKVLAAGIMQKAVREKGKFRTFLLVALDRFVLNRMRDQRAAKRSPTEGMAGSVEEAAEVCGSDGNMNRAFDVDWARTILEETISRMRETCRAGGRQSLWELFEDRVVGPSLHGAQPTPYAELSARFNFQSPAEAGNFVLTGRRMFIRLLREVIAEYASDEAAVDDEIADLRTILNSG